MKKRKYRSRLRKIFGRRLLIILAILFQIVLLALMLFSSNRFYWLGGLFTALSIATALHLMIRSDKSAFKLSLVFLILLFPLYGGVFYWVFHYQTANVGFRKRLESFSKKQRDGFERREDALLRATEAAPEDRKLLHYLQGVPAFPVYQNTASRYFPSGREMHASLLEDLRRAERYIFMEYFIIEEGLMWDSILEILTERAAHGVDVRLIYDDFGSILTLPPRYDKKMREAGIKCKIFNKFHPFLTTLQNNRDHRKITVIDGKVAYTGGVNLADEYIGEKIRFGVWKDSAIRLCGEGAASFTAMFLGMWCLLTQTEESLLSYLPSQSFGSVSDGWVQPYSDSPMDRENVGEHVFLHAASRTQRYLYITTPYLMVGDELLSALKFCAKSGADVRIITPHIPDKPAVHFTTRSYYRELVESGIRVYEFTDGFMHAKNVVSDGTFAVVGTVNLDYRSLYLHFECGVCLYGATTVAAVEEDFLKTLESCREITAPDCKSNFIVRLFQQVCRIFAPLM
ncbi:MAG: cardiolipin synthase [Ruminococcaceae bacterium]|nr:cardiolipin synthase [Oscillospiraceae bacterium]